MEQQDAHLRVRQTAAARVIGRAWQHVRLAIQVSGTACLALRRFDKAAVDEKKAMYTKFARVGQIMLDHKKLLCSQMCSSGKPKQRLLVARFAH